MSRLSFADYSPPELRLLASELEASAQELRAVAENLTIAKIESIQVSRAAGVEKGIRWARQFASDAHRAYLHVVVASKPTRAGAAPLIKEKTTRRR